eukprot:1572900-Amphidinium_carterae.1
MPTPRPIIQHFCSTGVPLFSTWCTTYLPQKSSSYRHFHSPSLSAPRMGPVQSMVGAGFSPPPAPLSPSRVYVGARVLSRQDP